jgi:hypothetical protein
VAGFFDLHVALSLQKGWASVVTDQAKWRALFPEIASGLADEWRAKLAPSDDASHLEVRPAFVPEQAKFPCVVVQYNDEPEDTAPINYFGGRYNPSDSSLLADQLDRSVALLVRQFVRLHIFTDHPETTRAMHIAVLQIMLQNRDVLYDLGYHDLEYLGGGDLTVEEDLMPNFLGAYVRVQRWAARGTIESTLVPVAGKPVLVASTDITVDGNLGGIEDPMEN